VPPPARQSAPRSTGPLVYSAQAMAGSVRRPELALLAIFAGAMVWSLVRPHDYFTWLLEVFPAIIGVIVLAATWRRFRLTTIAYSLICVHAIILLVGGHYTYA
jgi:putative membrane protein